MNSNLLSALRAVQTGRAPQRGCPAGDPACLRSQGGLK
jgi:hypothetical protein